MRELQGRLEALPGIENVAASTPFPLSGYTNSMRWGPEQALSDPSKSQAADYQIVLPGYFETMRMRLLDGRTFTEADNAPERKVVIIDQFLATKAFPNEGETGAGQYALFALTHGRALPDHRRLRVRTAGAARVRA